MLGLVAGGLVLSGSAMATAAAGDPIAINPGNVPTTAEDAYDGSTCPAGPEGTEGYDAWHFVVPGKNGEFVTLNASFDTNGDSVAELTRTLFDSVQFPTAKHAYVYTPPTNPATRLIAATATVSNGATFFVLSHACTGTPPETPKGVVSGLKYYDLDHDGQFDAGESGLEGWVIKVNGGTTNLVTDADGTFTATLAAGGYTFAEEPGMPPWIQTGNTVDQSSVTGGSTVGLLNKVYTVTLTKDGTASGLNFGNVCVITNTGGKTLGFWSNKNGKAILDAKAGWLDLLGGKNLVNANGTAFDPAGYAAFRTWLLAATATNMSYMLSAQYAATLLNVTYGAQNPGVYVQVVLDNGDGSTTISWKPLSTVLADANDFLAANPNTTAFGAARTNAEMYKNIFDGLNNNMLGVTPTDPDLCGPAYGAVS